LQGFAARIVCVSKSMHALSDAALSGVFPFSKANAYWHDCQSPTSAAAVATARADRMTLC
jgi:hypothetical protein